MRNKQREDERTDSKTVWNGIVYYFERYFEARKTWNLNKEFWVVTLVCLFVVFITFRWLGLLSIVIPILFVVYMWLYLEYRKSRERKVKR